MTSGGTKATPADRQITTAAERTPLYTSSSFDSSSLFEHALASSSLTSSHSLAHFLFSPISLFLPPSTRLVLSDFPFLSRAHRSDSTSLGTVGLESYTLFPSLMAPWTFTLLCVRLLT